MIRLFRVYFPGRTLLLALSEALVLVAVALPTGYAVLGSDASSLVFRSEFAKLLIVVAVCMACMHYHDLYNSMVLLNPLQGATRLVQVLGSACVILACIYYVYPGVQIDQTLLAIWILLAGVALIAWRKLFLTISQSARHTQRTVLLGAGPCAGGDFKQNQENKRARATTTASQPSSSTRSRSRDILSVRRPSLR